MKVSAAKLRGGIIGCGFFGRIHLEAWRRIPEARIVAACDLNPELARTAAPHAYCSAEKMLAGEQLDFVDIATRPESHLPLVRLAAAHKIPAICQKPIAPAWAEAVAMAEVAEAGGIRLMIHENWRWQPWYRAARRMLEEGRIGRPIAYWFCTRLRDGWGDAPYSRQPYFKQMPRLLIHETLVHYIDTARYLFGEIDAVCAQARRINPVIAGEDRAVLILTHREPLEGVIDGHRLLDPDPDPDGPAMGEACFEGDRGRIRIPAGGDVYLDGKKAWANEISDGYRGDSVAATQRHFIECLTTGRPFESEAREYLKTFGAVEAAYRSIAEHRAVPLSEVL